MSLILSLTVGLFVSMAMIPPLARVAPRLGLIDVPNGRKVHAHPIPRIGGIAIIAGLIIACLFWVPVDGWVAGYLLGAVVIAVFGLWDDRADLDYRLKFIGQFAAATIAVVIGGIQVTELPLIDSWVLPPVLAVPLTIVILVAITNAINLTDGLDGLAGGTTLIAVGCVGLLAHLAGDRTVAIISVSLIGALLGFLRYNSYPARVFLGDTGSQFLGFSACVLAIVLTQKSATALSPALPLLLLGLPVLDTTMVMTQRIAEGHSPFKPDRNHIHHRLLALGLDHYEVVVVIYGVQSMLVVAAFLFRFESDGFLLLFYALFASSTACLLILARYRGWKLKDGAGQHRLLARLVESMRRNRTVYLIAVNIVGVALPVVLLAGPLVATSVPYDFGFVAIICLVALFAASRGAGGGMLDRLAIYVAAAIAIFFLNQQLAASGISVDYLLVFCAAVAVAVGAVMRLGDTNAFAVSPLDFLVILLVLLVTYLASLAGSDPEVGRMATEMVILFYACEILLLHTQRYWRLLRLSAAIALVLYGVRSLLPLLS